MRKPVVVVTLILALTLSITLARRLAQPAITNERPTESPNVIAVAEANVVPAVTLAMPVRPTSALAVSGITGREDSSASGPQNDVRARHSRASATTSRAKRGILSSPKASSEALSTASYNAMLGSPDAAFRSVKDHGRRGIGTPQWIDSLSGAKGRVPVRDFAAEAAPKGQSFSDPLTVSVDSEVDSAH
jgi:hypothetical protein